MATHNGRNGDAAAFGTDPADRLPDEAFDDLFPADERSGRPARRGARVPRDAEAAREAAQAATDRRAADATERATESAAASLPDAAQLADEQHTAAVYRLHKDPLRAIHWRLPDVQAVAGPVKGGDLILTSARTGSGKTLFYQNLWDDLIEAGHAGLYIGTEQDPDVLKTKWACLRAGVHPRLILAPERHEVNTEDHRAAKDRVQAELKAISAGAYARRAIFAKDARRLDRRELQRWIRGAVRKYGIDFVIVDHIDRMNAGDGRNGAHEMKEMIVGTKEVAVEHDLAAFLASQVRRSPDKIIALTPPTLEDAAGSSGKEQEADLFLTVYRPLDPAASKEDMKQVRAGLLDPSHVWLRNVMGVKCLKHRVDDSRIGKVALVEVRGHRLEHRDSRHNHATTCASR